MGGAVDVVRGAKRVIETQASAKCFVNVAHIQWDMTRLDAVYSAAFRRRGGRGEDFKRPEKARKSHIPRDAVRVASRSR